MAELAFRRRTGPADVVPGSGRATGDPVGPDPQLALGALDTLTEGVVVAAPDGTVLVANPAATRMGLPCRGGTLPEALIRLAGAARRDGRPHDQLVTLPPPVDLPLRLRRDGRTGPPARVRATALGAGGEVALVLEDLSEATRIEAVRRDFVANVSHELKTPVGALQLLAEALDDARDDPDAVRRFAERMGREAARLGTLVQELIDLSRLQGAEPIGDARPTPLEAAVGEAIDRTRLAAQAKGISVAVVQEPSAGEGPMMVSGDENQLAMAVANLLSNAVRYSPERTRVVIGLARRDDVVEVSVADEGIGIAEADLERIFERFYRVDPARSRATGGTGLGLAIVKHIATNHGGEVTVWSAEGKGSTFTLHLPAWWPPPDTEATAHGEDRE